MTNVEINARISKLARGKKIGQRALATAVGVAQSGLCVALRSSKAWNNEQMDAFARILEISVQDLKTNDSRQNSTAVNEKTFDGERAKFAVGDRMINDAENKIGNLIAVATDNDGEQYAVFFIDADPSFIIIDQSMDCAPQPIIDRISEDLYGPRKDFNWEHAGEARLQEVLNMIEVARMMSELGDDVISEVRDGQRFYELSPAARKRLNREATFNESRTPMTKEDWDEVFKRRDDGQTWKQIWLTFPPVRTYRSMASMTTMVHAVAKKRLIARGYLHN